MVSKADLQKSKIDEYLSQNKVIEEGDEVQNGDRD